MTGQTWYIDARHASELSTEDQSALVVWVTGLGLNAGEVNHISVDAAMTATFTFGMVDDVPVRMPLTIPNTKPPLIPWLRDRVPTSLNHAGGDVKNTAMPMIHISPAPDAAAARQAGIAEGYAAGLARGRGER
jgi:hypothetical protein